MRPEARRKRGGRLAPIKRLFRHGHLDEEGNYGIYQLARYLGRRLPLPMGLKTWLHELLLRTRYPQQLLDNRIAAKQASKEASDSSAMQPARCGLVPGLVSVVLPVYNQAGLLADSIASVLAQTYPQLELILVNDGSTDDAQQVMAAASRDPRVRCFNQPNLGLPAALSNGFRQARGEYWTWTSADNALEPQMLAALVKRLAAEPSLGLVYADYSVMDAAGQPLKDPRWRWRDRPDKASPAVRLPRSADALNVVQDNFIGPCFLYRGWIGRVLGDYDPQTGIEDYDYWMRVNAFFPVKHLGSDALLYWYRVHENSISARGKDYSIVKKTMQLMRHEKRRAARFQSRLHVAADPPGEAWLRLEGLVETQFTPIPPTGSTAGFALAEPPPRSLTGRGRWGSEWSGLPELLVVSSAAAKAHLQALAALSTPTAVLLDPQGADCHALAPLLRRAGCIALAPDSLAAARLRLVADCPLLDAEAEQSPVAVLAFARNHQDFSQPQTQRQAQAPSQARRHDQPQAQTLAQRHDQSQAQPQAAALPPGQHLLLQVDSFVQGGMENVVLDLARTLTDTGYQLTLANLGEAGDAAAKAQAQGLAIKSWRRQPSPAEYLRWLKQAGVALVNAHYSVFAARECAAAGIPFIQTIHNAYVWLDPQAIRRHQQADPHTAAYACVSATAARYADQALGLSPAKMRVLPNGVNASRMSPNDHQQNRQRLRAEWRLPDSAPVFLNVASIMASKAQLPLVQAFATLLKQAPEARLVLLGAVMEPAYHRQLKQAAKRRGIASHILFAGYHRDPAPHYHAADVFVLPSFWEGWSLSLAEALACGMPAVATQVGAAEDFAGHPGLQLLAPPYGDITELNRQTLPRVLHAEDPAFVQRLAAAMLAAIPAISRTSRPLDAELAERLASRHAYARYASLFQACRMSPLAS